MFSFMYGLVAQWLRPCFPKPGIVGSSLTWDHLDPFWTIGAFPSGVGYGSVGTYDQRVIGLNPMLNKLATSLLSQVFQVK